MPVPAAQDRVAAVRRFNRFYTQRIGVLREPWLDSPFSLTEARVLYEIGQRAGVTASEIGDELGLDAGYLSRMLRRFHKDGLIRKQVSPADARQTLLSMTARGRKAFAPLEAHTRAQVGAMLERLGPQQQDRLVSAMGTVETLLAAEAEPTPGFILREPRAGDFGWIVARHAVLYAQEYGWTENFEGLCAQIVADFVNNFDPTCERGWIAERDGEPVGSILLAKDTPEVARLRLLLGGAVGARARHRQSPDRRLHRLRARARLPPHHAVDPRRAHRRAPHLRARRLPAHLKRGAQELEPGRGSEYWDLDAGLSVASSRVPGAISDVLRASER